MSDHMLSVLPIKGFSSLKGALGSGGKHLCAVGAVIERTCPAAPRNSRFTDHMTYGAATQNPGRNTTIRIRSIREP